MLNSKLRLECLVLIISITFVLRIERSGIQHENTALRLWGLNEILFHSLFAWKQMAYNKRNAKRESGEVSKANVRWMCTLFPTWRHLYTHQSTDNTRTATSRHAYYRSSLINIMTPGVSLRMESERTATRQCFGSPMTRRHQAALVQVTGTVGVPCTITTTTTTTTTVSIVCLASVADRCEV